jgi:hypothetical protein
MWCLGPYVTSWRDFWSYEAPHSPPREDRMRRLVQALAQEHGVSCETMRTSHQQIVVKEIRDQFAEYCRNVAEEWQVLNTSLGSAQFGPILDCFPNLIAFKIVNGTFSLADNGNCSFLENEIIKESLDGMNSVPVPSGLDLRKRGEGLWSSHIHHQVAAIQTSISICAQKPNKIEHLEIDHLPWQVFLKSSFLESFLKAHTNSWALTRLRLTVPLHLGRWWNYGDMGLCRKTMSHGLLKQFITTLPKLVDLSLLFPQTNEEYHEAARLSDVLPSTIVNLQKLRLEYFDTSETFFTHILHANAPTLQELGLVDMCLESQGSWIRIFKFLHRHHTQLRSVTLGGNFGDSVWSIWDPHPFQHPVEVSSLENKWSFRNIPSLARRLERYLVHGGPCPLLNTDKEGVMLGLIDPVHCQPRISAIKRRLSASQAKTSRIDPLSLRITTTPRARRDSVGP